MNYKIFFIFITCSCINLSAMDYNPDLEEQVPQADTIRTAATLKTLIKYQDLEAIIHLRKVEGNYYCAAIKAGSKSDAQSVVGYAKTNNTKKCPNKIAYKLLRDITIGGAPIAAGTYWYMNNNAVSALCNALMTQIDQSVDMIDQVAATTLSELPTQIAQTLTQALASQSMLISQTVNNSLTPMTNSLILSSAQLEPLLNSVMNITDAIPSISTTILPPTVVNLLPPVVQTLITTTNKLPPLLSNLTSGLNDLQTGITQLTNVTAEFGPTVQELITNTSHVANNTAISTLGSFSNLSNITGLLNTVSGQLSNAGHTVCDALDLKFLYIIPIVLVGVGVVYLLYATSSRAIEASRACRIGNKRAHAIATLIESDYDDCRIKKD